MCPADMPMCWAALMRHSNDDVQGLSVHLCAAAAERAACFAQMWGYMSMAQVLTFTSGASDPPCADGACTDAAPDFKLSAHARAACQQVC